MKTLTIGADSKNTLVISDDPYVSSFHAKIVQDENHNTFLMDEGSTNGTWVIRFGRKFRVEVPTPIYLGDIVVIGRTEIPWSK